MGKVADKAWYKKMLKNKKRPDIFEIMFEPEIVKSFRGPVKGNWWNLSGDKKNPSKTMGLTPPLQPFMVLVEGDNLNYESFIFDFVNVFAGTGGFKLEGLKLQERFFYSESSQLHGNMLQKTSYQRNQAKEYLASIQNLKTAIINIESDMEKMNEQLNAFKAGDWDQIKGLFIDNYGGPQRSWTAVARNVPLVRMAMTWFLRLQVKLKTGEAMPIQEFTKLKITEFTKTKDKDGKDLLGPLSKKISERKAKMKKAAQKNKEIMIAEIDELVKSEQMNPAIANYLNRKIQEFWNWVIDYVGWLTRNRNNIQVNLIQQKANLKLYMRWAADHILQSRSSEMESMDLAEEMPEFDIKGSPSEMVRIDYLFYPNDQGRPDLFEVTEPWIPVIGTSIMVATSVELQRKFMELATVTMHGYALIEDIEAISNYVKSPDSQLINIMLEAGAVTEDELPLIFTKEEIKEMKGEIEEKPEKFADKWNKGMSTAVNNFKGMGRLFGIDLPAESLPWTRERRAATIAADLTNRGIRNFKKGAGMLTLD
ncbi:MAG: hypothetical protein GOU98_04240 [Candidatus Altiarchaeota archaeon]|nr:hypothetical protein [Candidatus Altiarchaeota archaeon]